MNTGDDNKKTDERLARDAQRLLRQSAEELDAATNARLKRVRRNALAEYDRRGRRPAWFRAGWQPALGAAAVFATASIAVVLWVGRVPGPVPPAAAPPPASAAVEPPEDLEVVLVDDENLEMIEDLEFYDWLDSDPAMEAAPDPELSG